MDLVVYFIWCKETKKKQGDKGFFPKEGEENPYNDVSLSPRGLRLAQG